MKQLSRVELLKKFTELRAEGVELPSLEMFLQLTLEERNEIIVEATRSYWKGVARRKKACKNAQLTMGAKVLYKGAGDFEIVGEYDGRYLIMDKSVIGNNVVFAALPADVEVLATSVFSLGMTVRSVLKNKDGFEGVVVAFSPLDNRVICRPKTVNTSPVGRVCYAYKPQELVPEK